MTMMHCVYPLVSHAFVVPFLPCVVSAPWRVVVLRSVMQSVTDREPTMTRCADVSVEGRRQGDVCFLSEASPFGSFLHNESHVREN
eukprot:scaffold106040_cov42-Attheya_sp.AAC.3